MALVDPPTRRDTGGWRWAAFFAARLALMSGATYKALTARTGLRAIMWLAFAGAALVVMLGLPPYAVYNRQAAEPFGVDKAFDSWFACTLAAAAWYGVLAALLRPPRGRTSQEEIDGRVVLAGLWMAWPLVATHLVVVNISWPSHGPPYRFLVWTTRAMFGRGDWEGGAFPHGRRLGAHMKGELAEPILLAAGLLITSGLPFAIALFSGIRIVARRRWLRLVEVGRVSGYRLTTTIPSQRADLPLLTGSARGPWCVLASASEGAVPYRDECTTPVALVAWRSSGTGESGVLAPPDEASPRSPNSPLGR